MRTFLTGLICGAFAGALAVHVWSTPATPLLSNAGLAPVNTSSSSQASASWAAPPVAKPQTSLPVPAVEAKASASVPVSAAPIPSIALSAEHAKMLALTLGDGRPPTPPELHAQLATEAKDTAWAYAMEQSIRQALTAANTSGEIDIVNVDCRQSLCEVLAFGNLPTSLERWNQVWDEVSKQPWHTGMSRNASAVSTQGGRQTFATFLRRSGP